MATLYSSRGMVQLNLSTSRLLTGVLQENQANLSYLLNLTPLKKAHEAAKIPKQVISQWKPMWMMLPCSLPQKKPTKMCCLMLMTNAQISTLRFTRTNVSLMSSMNGGYAAEPLSIHSEYCICSIKAPGSNHRSKFLYHQISSKEKLYSAVHQTDQRPIQGEFKAWTYNYLVPSLLFNLAVDHIPKTNSRREPPPT